MMLTGRPLYCLLMLCSICFFKALTFWIWSSSWGYNVWSEHSRSCRFRSISLIEARKRKLVLRGALIVEASRSTNLMIMVSRSRSSWNAKWKRGIVKMKHILTFWTFGSRATCANDPSSRLLRWTLIDSNFGSRFGEIVVECYLEQIVVGWLRACFRNLASQALVGYKMPSTNHIIHINVWYFNHHQKRKMEKIHKIHASNRSRKNMFRVTTYPKIVFFSEELSLFAEESSSPEVKITMMGSSLFVDEVSLALFPPPSIEIPKFVSKFCTRSFPCLNTYSKTFTDFCASSLFYNHQNQMNNELKWIWNTTYEDIWLKSKNSNICWIFDELSIKLNGFSNGFVLNQGYNGSKVFIQLRSQAIQLTFNILSLGR